MDEAVEIVVTQNINNSSGRDSPSNGDVDSNRPELSDFMHRGYIKLWRKTDDWAFSQHPLAVALWVSLLRLATYKPIKKMFNGNIVTLEPGQLITGRLFLEGFTGISGNSIEKYLTFFEEQNQIAQQKTNHNRLITITNWSKYQGEIEPPCTATCTTERQPLAQQPAQQKDTHKKIRSKEDKNIRNNTLALPDGFAEFWAVYPRKVGKDKAVEAWLKKSPSPTDVLSALAWQAESEDWTKEGGKYIPYPATYLNQGRWKDEPKGKKGSEIDELFNRGQG